jgi:hypothetical protein
MSTVVKTLLLSMRCLSCASPWVCSPSLAERACPYCWSHATVVMGDA